MSLRMIDSPCSEREEFLDSGFKLRKSGERNKRLWPFPQSR
jgi:hypothetical protein